MSLVTLDEKKFTGPIHTVEPRLFIQLDSCLFIQGHLIKGGPNRDIPFGGSAVDISRFGYGEDSSFQNVAEFAVAIMGIVMIVKMGILLMVKDYGVGLRGDSINALGCISVANAAMVYTILGIACSSMISDAVYLSATNNWRADGLS